jgi:hypothetical protein
MESVAEGRKAYSSKIGGFMGLKGKFLFMLIVYFAGFATAVYYLSPDGRLAAANASESRSYDGQSKAAAVLMDFRDSAREKIAGMDKQDFKDAYYRAVEAIKRMANKTGQRGSEVSQDSQVSDGGEDK